MILYDVTKTIYGTYKPFARLVLVVLSTDPDMALKSHARGSFELFGIFSQKISACGTPILPLDCFVILYDVFKAMCDAFTTYSYVDTFTIGLKSFTRLDFAICCPTIFIKISIWLSHLSMLIPYNMLRCIKSGKCTYRYNILKYNNIIQRYSPAHD